MIVDNYYTITILINDSEIIDKEKLISFSLHENIYSLFPKSLFTINDQTSVIQESSIFSIGTKLDFDYGLKDDVSNRASYIVTKDSLPKIDRIGNLIGEIDLELAPGYYYPQNKISAAFQDTVPNIIQKKIVHYPFSSTDITSSKNLATAIHYQPLISDAEFIEKKLVPIMFSKSVSNTPFYAYITTDNVFHFKSLQEMYNEKPVASYIYKKEPIDSTQSVDLKAMVLSIARIGTELKEYKKTFKKSIYTIGRDDGLSQKIPDVAYNKLLHNKDKEKLPIVWADSNVQDYIDQDYSEDDPGQSDILKGNINYKYRESMFVDRFLCLFPFNPQLHAGNKINLTIFTLGNTETTVSNRYTRDYIIEDLEHIWNGDERKGYTKVIIGNRYVDMNSQIYKNMLNYLVEA